MENARTTSWAEHEFGGAKLGDRRRTERLVWLAEQRSRQPTASLPECCGSGAGVKAAYRFYETVTIRPQAILAPHRRATLARMAEHPVVLLPQDTTQVDYTSHTDTVGLGVLQNKHQRGLLLHTTLAVTPERVPLGVVDQQTWTRDPSQFGKRHNRKTRPTSEKESQKWLDSLAVAAELQAALPGVRLVSIADREGDVYDFMRQATPEGPAILVRASWDRAVDHPQGHLWAFLESQPVAGELTISVPRQPGQPTRVAQLSVRFAPVTLKPPRTRLKAERLPPLRLWGVLAREEGPPAGEQPIEWLLLSSLPVDDLAAAAERVQWYSCRWLVEIYHKVLKSGCRIEARQLETAANLKRYLAVDGVVAWQLLYLTMLGRQLPDAPCTAVLEAHEWQALYCFTHKVARPPTTPPKLHDAVRWIAKLGGFLDRTADGEPGVTTLWRGLQRLHDIAAAWQLFHALSSIPDQDVGND
jgi:hypothetical protein